MGGGVGCTAFSSPTRCDNGGYDYIAVLQAAVTGAMILSQSYKLL